MYPENPSKGPAPPGCQDVYDATAAGNFALPYEDQRRCPNSQNLIAIMGDSNGDRICDVKCNIQIQGTGDSPDDVMIAGDRAKLNVFRADRADGFYLKNMTVEKSDFNNIYVLETNGFRIDTVVSRYSREYGILSFTSDHGIYENCEASYNGDSGVYPGSGPDARHGQPDARGLVYGIVIRNCDSHHNTIGYSGTAGNGIWAYNNRFHHNSAGLTTDSFASGHPGMPQDHSKWSNNFVYSNNFDLFNAERDAYCQNTPPTARDPKKVCPTFQVPVGTGMLIAGGNGNIVEGNYIWDNWRDGTMLHWVPATLRGEADAARNYDTSSNNAYRNNCMSMQPPTTDPATTDFSVCTGTRDPNGVDFWWDEEEGQDCDPNQAGCVDTDTTNGNCWSGNSGPGGMFTSDPMPLLLPACPGSDAVPARQLGQAGVPGAVRDLEPRDQPGSAGLRLVHGAERAHLIRRFAGPLLAVAAALLMLGGCGDDDDGGPPLAWGTPPRVLTPPDLEGDRVLRGVIRNDTGKTVRVTADDVRVLAGDGKRLPSAATFIAGYAHRLYPPTREPRDIPESERRRLGDVAVIEPGQQAAVTVSWRLRNKADRAATIDFGTGELEVPRESLSRARGSRRFESSTEPSAPRIPLEAAERRDQMLNEAQRETLQAVCDTVVPSIEQADDPHGVWARKASDLGVPQMLEDTIALMPPEQQEGMLQLLDGLGAQQFARASQLSREQILRNVSLLGTQASAGVGALVGLTLFCHYGAPDPETGQNPNWAAYGYPGPIDAPKQAEKPIKPLVPDNGALDLEADVCIVGSGAGGGVIAGTLAGQGLKVVVLEAGGYFDESDFNQLELWAYQNLYWRGGPQQTADLNVTLQAGAGLGGGTVINWTNCLRTHPWVRDEWAALGLEGLAGGDFDRHLDTVLGRISATDQCSELNGPQQKMLEGAERLGWSWRTVVRNTDRGSYSTGGGRLPGIRGPVRFQAEHPEDLPARRVRERRRHRRALLRRADPGRGRPRGRR